MDVCPSSYPTASQPLAFPYVPFVDAHSLAIPNGIEAGVYTNHRLCTVPMFGLTYPRISLLLSVRQETIAEAPRMTGTKYFNIDFI